MFLACFVTAWAIARIADPYFYNTPLDWLFLVVTCSCQLFYFVVSPFLYEEYAWVLYRKSVLDKQLRAIYIKYLIWLCFLRLDSAFGILSVLLSGKGICNAGLNAGLDYATFAVCIIFLAVGYYVIKKELVVYTRLWFLLFPLLPAYDLAFLVIQYKTALDSQQEHTLYTLRVLFTVSSVCALLSRVGLIYFTYVVYNNFGKGLLNLEEAKEREKAKKKLTPRPEQRVKISQYHMTITLLMKITLTMMNGLLRMSLTIHTQWIIVII